MTRNERERQLLLRRAATAAEPQSFQKETD
jgi:hypothetical protein